MNPDTAGAKPLVVVEESGDILDLTTMNRKGFTKSTEQGELWYLHEETGRVLPYDEKLKLLRVVDDGRWYRAVVRGAGTSEVRSSKEREAESKRTGGDSGLLEAGSILEELSGVIAARRLERPEGSYTTYLFDSGEEKIRKKTGEEAIELVLARRREEVVSESADLIYHLLVLLNQLNIPLKEVLSELQSRA